MSNEEIKSILERIESMLGKQLEENRDFQRTVAYEMGRSAGASDVTNKSMFFLTAMLGMFAILQIFVFTLSLWGIWFSAFFALFMVTAFIVTFYLAVVRSIK